MKKKIAVYDSKKEDCKMTAEIIREYYERQFSIAEVIEYYTSYEFLCDFRDNYYDMVFLAINRPFDLETGRNIRNIDVYCPLFFVSDVPDYGIEGYRLSVFDYLIKPVTYERIYEAIERIGSSFGKGKRREVNK